MEHKGTVRLETERLILRRVTMTDVEPAFKNWVTDERVTRFLTWQPHESVAVTEQIFRAWIEDYSSEEHYLWAIVPKDLGEPIGTISGVRIFNEEERIDMGYCIGYDFWGKGYVAEALKRIIEFFFTEVKAKRIVALYDKNNPNSGRVMQKAGMKYFATLPQCGTNNQGTVDLVAYEILK